MAQWNRAEDGEELKSVLVVLDAPTWEEYKRESRRNGDSPSVRLRRFMTADLAAMKGKRRTHA